jgi:pimeloyl-ACP methyl ester carboxylesterase
LEATLTQPDGCKLFYTIDDYTDPWREPETVLFVHGLAESGEAWRAWMPHFAGHYRCVRVDLRGFGRSTPMPAEYVWTMQALIDNLAALIAHLGGKRVHLIGAKSGGSMALKLAADHPELINTLVGVTPPLVGASGVPEWIAHIDKHGVHDWAKTTMQGRLGSKVSQAEVDWWVNNIQSKTPLSTMQGYLRWVPSLDIRGDVEKITAPTLIFTTTGSGLRTVDSVKAWQPRIKNSKLIVLEGDAWHAAGAYPDRCAEASLEFIRGQK